MKNKKIKSESTHITKFLEKYVYPIKELDYEVEVCNIDFLIMDNITKIPKLCVEAKKDVTKKEKMFQQLQNTKGIINMRGSYDGFYGAINSKCFYIKDND